MELAEACTLPRIYSVAHAANAAQWQRSPAAVRSLFSEAQFLALNGNCWDPAHAVGVHPCGGHDFRELQLPRATASAAPFVPLRTRFLVLICQTLQQEDRLAKLKSEISTKEMELKSRPGEYAQMAEPIKFDQTM